MDLEEKRKEIIETSAKEVIVLSSAASGKTDIITKRLKYLLDNGAEPSKIVTITFTNLAAEELRTRVGEKGKECFIGTIHSYCNSLLTRNGVSTYDLIKDEEFDELFNLIKANLNCVKPVDYVLLDEAQDSNYLQLEFLLDTIRPKSYFLCGDYRQSIYQYDGATPEALLELAAQDEVTVYHLNENFRNKKEILDFAKQIIRQNGIDYIDNSTAMRGSGGKVISTTYSPTGITRTIKKYGGYKDWFILCRTNQDIEEIAAYLREGEVPCAVLRRKDFDTLADLRNKLQEDSVKVMTIHASKGLEADNVIIIGAVINKRGSHQVVNENNCLNYVAATRARNLLVWAFKERYKKTTVRSFE